MFGLSCAQEMYQNVMQQTLQGYEGVHYILDDIIVYWGYQQEHDQILNRVLEVLKEKGLTLNKGKCELNMSQLIFMGHVLSARGIGPAEVKVEAVNQARESKNASEVKSFLGLVNYSGRFLPDLATLSTPLIDLTQMNTEFIWGKKQQLF